MTPFRRQQAERLFVLRAHLDDPSLDLETRAALYDIAAKTLTEPELKEAASHNAFMCREAMRNQLAFSDLLK